MRIGKNSVFRFAVVILLLLSGCSNSMIASERKLLSGNGDRVFPENARFFGYSEKDDEDDDGFLELSYNKSGQYVLPGSVLEEEGDLLFSFHPLGHSRYLAEFFMTADSKPIYYYAPVRITENLLSIYDADYAEIASEFKVRGLSKVEGVAFDAFLLQAGKTELERLIGAGLKSEPEPAFMFFDMSNIKEKAAALRLYAERVGNKADKLAEKAKSAKQAEQKTRNKEKAEAIAKKKVTRSAWRKLREGDIVNQIASTAVRHDGKVSPQIWFACNKSKLFVQLEFGEAVVDSYRGTQYTLANVSSRIDNRDVKTLGFSMSDDAKILWSTYQASVAGGIKSIGVGIDNLIFDALGIKNRPKMSWTPWGLANALSGATALTLRARTSDGDYVTAQFDVSDFRASYRELPRECRNGTAIY